MSAPKPRICVTLCTSRPSTSTPTDTAQRLFLFGGLPALSSSILLTRSAETGRGRWIRKRLS